MESYFAKTASRIISQTITKKMLEKRGGAEAVAIPLGAKLLAGAKAFLPFILANIGASIAVPKITSALIPKRLKRKRDRQQVPILNIAESLYGRGPSLNAQSARGISGLMLNRILSAQSNFKNTMVRRNQAAALNKNTGDNK